MKRVKAMNFLILSLTGAMLSICTLALAAPPNQASPRPGASPLAKPPAAALSRIGYGLSYGECMGYCEHHLIITAKSMRLVHKAMTELEKYPEQVVEKPTPTATWQKLLRLASFQTLKGLPERIGCPDCTDGGAEWVELQQGNAGKRVTFEAGESLRQQAALLAELRKLYQDLNPDTQAS